MGFRRGLFRAVAAAERIELQGPASEEVSGAAVVEAVADSATAAASPELDRKSVVEGKSVDGFQAWALPSCGRRRTHRATGARVGGGFRRRGRRSRCGFRDGGSES